MFSMNDLGNAVAQEKRRLLRGSMLYKMLVSPSEDISSKRMDIKVMPVWLVEQVLRIEVSEQFFWEEMRRNSLNGAVPATFMGITVYCCGPEHNLPECGWRVVNPFNDPRSKADSPFNPSTQGE